METASSDETVAMIRERIPIMVHGRMPVTINQNIDEIHSALGHSLLNHVGISRSEGSLTSASEEVAKIKNSFDKGVRIPSSLGMNTYLEKALRLSDYFGLAELMIEDAKERQESCGAHFREEYQTSNGSAKRDDDNFCHISAWEKASNGKLILHKESLSYEKVNMTTRSYA